MKKAIIMMIVVFALVVWPFSGVWQLLSGIIGGGVRESFIYPIYGGITKRLLKDFKQIIMWFCLY